MRLLISSVRTTFNNPYKENETGFVNSTTGLYQGGKPMKKKLLAIMVALVACTVGCQMGDDDKVGSEDCTDGRDNDGDGLIDCNDGDCSGYIGCRDDPPDCPDPSNPACPDPCQTNPANCGYENCTDGVDNDGDGLVDCEDSYCDGAAHCQCQPENCSDGRDNDCDGQVDCDDPDCNGSSACCLDYEICGDGLDNDCNGKTDCADSACWTEEECWCATVQINLPDGGLVDIVTGAGVHWGQSVQPGWYERIALVPEDLGATFWIGTDTIDVLKTKGVMYAWFPGLEYPCDFEGQGSLSNHFAWANNWNYANFTLGCGN
jgi:hypothetical protein